MANEFNALLSNDIWSLILAVNYKRVFKIKCVVDGLVSVIRLD